MDVLDRLEEDDASTSWIEVLDRPR